MSANLPSVPVTPESAGWRFLSFDLIELDGISQAQGASGVDIGAMDEPMAEVVAAAEEAPAEAAAS